VSHLVDITEISAVVAAAGVLVGVIYYIVDMRHQSRSRRTDSFWRILSTFNSKEYLEAIMTVFSLDFRDYDDFTSKYGDLLSGKCTVGVPISMVGNLFEGAGFLFHNGLMEYDTVNQFPVIFTWEKMKVIAEGARKAGFSGMWVEFEYLYNEMKKRTEVSVAKSLVSAQAA